MRVMPYLMLASIALSSSGSAPALAKSAAGQSIRVSAAWTRATASHAAVGAGFLTIRNAGKAPDRLVSASTPRAERVEIHTMTMDGGIMRMRPLPSGIAIAAGAESRLAPGGNHLMLMNLKSPLRTGETIPLTLRFARAGAIAISLKVGTAGSTGPDAAPDAHGHGGHK